MLSWDIVASCNLDQKTFYLLLLWYEIVRNILNFRDQDAGLIALWWERLCCITVSTSHRDKFPPTERILSDHSRGQKGIMFPTSLALTIVHGAYQRFRLGFGKKWGFRFSHAWVQHLVSSYASHLGKTSCVLIHSYFACNLLRVFNISYYAEGCEMLACIEVGSGVRKISWFFFIISRKWSSRNSPQNSRSWAKHLVDAEAKSFG